MEAVYFEEKQPGYSEVAGLLRGKCTITPTYRTFGAEQMLA